MADGLGSADPGVVDREDTAQLLDLTLRLYEAALQPQPWPTIMRAIAPLMGTEKAMFVRVDRTHPRDSVTEVIGLADEHALALRQRDLEQDFLWRAVLGIAAGQVFRSTELLPLNVLHMGPLYEQIAVPAGLEYVLGGIIQNNTQFFSHLCYMQAAADFDDRRKRLLTLLMPHLQNIQQISRRIAAGDAGQREALLSFDRAQQALIVLDRSGFAIHINEIAERVLGNATGLQLKFGRFLFDNIAVQMDFERAVRTAVMASTGEGPPRPLRIRAAGPDASAATMLTVIPVSSWSDRALLPEGAGCMVLIFDERGRRPLPVDRLVWLYQLTPAEARTCEALYKAGSVEAAAQLLNLTHHTVRSHLKSIYPKFGVSSQAQLMQRLANAAHQLVDGMADTKP